MSDPLYIWTLYDHPTDLPHSFVARKFAVEPSGPYATKDVLMTESLDTLRDLMFGLGLTPLSRSPEDDAKIIESWI